MDLNLFLKYAGEQKAILKRAFVSSDDLNKQAGAAGAMPPEAAGGMMPPPPPPGPEAGGAMPPMPPEGAMPPEGGAPAPEGPSPDEVVDMLDNFSQAMQGMEGDLNAVKQEVQELRVEIAKAMGTMETVLNILNKGAAQAPKVTNL